MEVFQLSKYYGTEKDPSALLRDKSEDQLIDYLGKVQQRLQFDVLHMKNQIHQMRFLVDELKKRRKT